MPADAQAREILDRDRVRERVEAGASVLSGKGRPMKPSSPIWRTMSGGEPFPFVPLASTRLHHLVRELAGHLTDLDVLL